jgi:hypothetical protein
LNTDVIDAAMDLAIALPNGWLQDSTNWATRYHGSIRIGLAGHIAATAGCVLHWDSNTADATEWVRRDSLPEEHRQAADNRAKELDWPDDVCSIFYAACLLTGINEETGLKLFSKGGSITYTLGLIEGYKIGAEL